MQHKEFDYKPRLVNEDGEPVFEGTCRIRILSLEERLKQAKGMRLKANETGEYDLTESADLVSSFIKVAKDNILSLDLKCEDVEIKDVNDLEFYEEGMKLLQEIGQVMIGGLKLGKRSASKSKNS